MDFLTFPFQETPLLVRGLFLGNAEQSWPWFEVLAATTLERHEQARVHVLFDSSNTPLAAIPTVLTGRNSERGLTAPYTTVFSPPWGTLDSARRLGLEFGTALRGRLTLDCLPDDALNSAFLAGLRLAGLPTAQYFHFANWYESLSDADTYIANRPSNIKATIQRKTAKLRREHEFRFAKQDLKGSRDASLKLYREVYERSWKSAEPDPGFIDCLLTTLGRLDLASLLTLEIDGAPAAAQIWLTAGESATLFKLAQDQRFDQYSPGTLLTNWSIREICKMGTIRTIDLGRGNDAYKQNWARFNKSRYGAIAASYKSITGLKSIILDIFPTRVRALLHADDVVGTNLSSRNV